MLWAAIVLSMSVMISGVGVVYTKYLNRKTFSQLQAINAECVQAETRWMRLQLEESTSTSYLRVESQARNKLGLHIPVVGEIHLLR